MKLTTLAACCLFLGIAAPVSAQVPNPTSQRMEAARQANYCRDLWVTIAIWHATGNTRNPYGIGEYGECNTKLYNGGNWGSFAELLNAVQATMGAMNSQGASFSLNDNRNRTITISTNVGGLSARVTVSGQVVATGGGNVVATGGGNLLSQDGSTVVATGGGNYRVLSAGQRAVPLPGGRVLVVSR